MAAIFGCSIQAALAAVTFAAQTAPADSAESILERAALAYRETATLQASFVQRIEIRALERESEGRGVVYQKKPNLFLMRFEQPEGDMVVSDGEWFWMYHPSAQPDQVIRTAVDRTAEGATLSGGFLRNPGERYVATYAGREAVDGRAAHVLSLVPKFEAGYTLVRVWVDVRDHLIRKFEIHEVNGNIRTLALSDVETGIDLPDRLFTFTPPAGVEVYTR